MQSEPIIPPSVETSLKVAGYVAAVLAATWGLLKFLFWPRIEKAIREEITAALRDLRDDLSRDRAGIEHSVDEVKTDVRAIRAKVEAQALQQAADGAIIKMLAGRRELPSDLFPHDSAR